MLLPHARADPPNRSTWLQCQMSRQQLWHWGQAWCPCLAVAFAVQELAQGQPTSAASSITFCSPPSPRLAPFGLQKNTQKVTEDPELLTWPLPGHNAQGVRVGQAGGNTRLPLKQGKTSLAPSDLQHPAGHSDARPAPGQPLVRMGSLARHPSATGPPAARCTGALASPQLRGQGRGAAPIHAVPAPTQPWLPASLSPSSRWFAESSWSFSLHTES